MAAAGAFVKGRWLRQGKAPVRVRRRPGLGNWGGLRQAAARLREPILACAGDGRLGASAGLIRHTRACPLWRACGRRLLAGSRRTSVKARTAGGGPAPFPPAFSDTGEPAPTSLRRRWRLGAVAKAASRCRSPLIPRPHPRGSAFKVCGCASAPPHGCPAMACCRHPAGAGRQRPQGRRQPCGWCVDGIVVTCSDPARRCRAAPAGALGEAVFAEW